MGAFHFVKISGISGSAVNGTRFVGSSHWKIPRKSGKSKKVVPVSRLEFPNGMSCSIYVSLSLYQFQVHGRAPRHVPRFTTKWNNFYRSEIPLLLPLKFPGFFRKWKAPFCFDTGAFVPTFISMVRFCMYLLAPQWEQAFAAFELKNDKCLWRGVGMFRID